MYKKLYDLKNFGIRGEELVVDVGANAKMNEFCAIMGLCNLKHINETLQARKICYEYYLEQFQNIKGIELFHKNASATCNYAYFPIIIGDEFSLTRNQLYDYLKKIISIAESIFIPLLRMQHVLIIVMKNRN